MYFFSVFLRHKLTWIHLLNSLVLYSFQQKQCWFCLLPSTLSRCCARWPWVQCWRNQTKIPLYLNHSWWQLQLPRNWLGTWYLYVPHHYCEKLITLAQDTQMSQLVTFPTKGNNILYLCICTHPDSVLSCEPIPGFSDHDAIILSIQTTRPVIKQHPQTIYLYKSADCYKIRVELSELSHVYFELNNNSSSHTLEENWSFFHRAYKKIIENHTPTKVSSTRRPVHSIETINTKETNSIL